MSDRETITPELAEDSGEWTTTHTGILVPARNAKLSRLTQNVAEPSSESVFSND